MTRDIYVFVSRVPKHCAHGRDAQSIHLTKNPNQTSAETWLEPGSREYRNMMRAKVHQSEFPPDPDAWPDWYVVTLCDACESERWSAWRDMHWRLDPYQRQTKAVYALAYLEAQTEPREESWSRSIQLTQQGADDVLTLVRNCRLSRGDFWELDSKPGKRGYEIDGREWHWKLRQVRNRDNRLFEVLAQNEADGSKDENIIPAMPIDWRPAHWPAD